MKTERRRSGSTFARGGLYWTEVSKLSEGGFTLAEAIEERWPEDREWIATKRAQWHGVDDPLLEDEAMRARDPGVMPRKMVARAARLSRFCRSKAALRWRRHVYEQQIEPQYRRETVSG